jgi:hypothetical protein
MGCPVVGAGDGHLLLVSKTPKRAQRKGLPILEMIATRAEIARKKAPVA